MSTNWIVGCLIAIMVVFGLPVYLLVANQSSVVGSLVQLAQTSNQDLSQSLNQVVQTLGQSFSELGQSNVSVQSPQPSPTFGALPSLQSPVCVAGVCEYYYSQTMRQASSTLCDIQTPNATTTIGKVTAFINTGATYAQTYELGYSATQDATTSAMVASFSVGASAKGVAIVATTTATAPVDGILGPNTHVVFNLSTSTATGANQAIGSCTLRVTAVPANPNSN